MFYWGKIQTWYRLFNLQALIVQINETKATKEKKILHTSKLKQ